MTAEDDAEHKARMKKIELEHKRKMLAIQQQANFEKAEHNSIMARINEQSNSVERTGELDVNQFSSKILAFSYNKFLV